MGKKGKVLISVSQTAVIQAELAIDGCSSCSIDASLPFWRVLDSFRRYTPDQVEYILPVLGLCPKCRNGIDETTLVKPKWNLAIKRSD
jgi:hypothetical protein